MGRTDRGSVVGVIKLLRNLGFNNHTNGVLKPIFQITTFHLFEENGIQFVIRFSQLAGFGIFHVNDANKRMQSCVITK